MLKNSSPLISVIMPCYNPRFDYFEEAIESVLAQSYANWELILVNDGGNKESTLHLEEFTEGFNDKRFVLLHLDKNFGPSVAKNKGIELSKGELITFLDADDIHLPWHYEEIIKGFCKNPNRLILIAQCLLYLRLGKIKKINLDKTYFDLLNGTEKPDNLLNDILTAKIGMTPTLALKREVFKIIHFNPSHIFGEDTDLYLQILKNDRFVKSISIFEKSGYLYRQYPSLSRITHAARLMFENRKKIVDRYKNDNSLAGNMIRYRQKHSDDWKYCVLFEDLIKNGFTLKHLKFVFTSFSTFEDKIKYIIVFIKTTFAYGFLMPFFGINERYLRILFNRNSNRYRTFKKLYQEHLDTYDDEKAKYYAGRIFKKVF